MRTASYSGESWPAIGAIVPIRGLELTARDLEQLDLPGPLTVVGPADRRYAPQWGRSVFASITRGYYYCPSSEAISVLSHLVESAAFSSIEYSLTDPALPASLVGRWRGLVDRALTRRGDGLYYTQDDDALIDARKFTRAALELVRPGVIVCNMDANRREQYRETGIGLVGFGALFHDLTAVHSLAVYDRYFERDAIFEREIDRVVTGLAELEYVDVEVEHLANCRLPDRMHRQTDHFDALAEIRRRINYIKSRVK